MSKSELSMTPPLTPLQETESDGDLDYMGFITSSNKIEESKATITPQITDYLFKCKGQAKLYSALENTSYLGNNLLSNLLNFGRPIVNENPDSDICDTSIFFYENISHCFSNIKKDIQLLERVSKPIFFGSISEHSRKYGDIRGKSINTLVSLSPLISFIGRDDTDFLLLVAAHIVELLIFLGPFHFCQRNIINSTSHHGNKCAFPSFHLFHLHLDVRWWALALLHQIEWILGRDLELPPSHPLQSSPNFFNELFSTSTSDKLSNKSLLDATLDFILWDIVILMERHTAEMSKSELANRAAFPCSCLCELVVTVIHLSTYRHQYLNKEEIWLKFNKKILSIMKMKNERSNSIVRRVSGITYPPSTYIEISNIQLWIFFKTFAQCFNFDRYGFYTNLSEMNSKACDIKMLRTLIIFTIVNSKDMPNEEDMRVYLHCCLDIHLMWGPFKDIKHSDWLVSLWDHFIKVLDTTFSPMGNSMEGFTQFFKTPAAFMEHIYLIKSSFSNNAKGMNSWALFLCLLASVIETNEREWKYLKGRIFSKFHPRKMSEISAIGLYHVAELFLTVATITDTPSLCEKLCDLLRSVVISSNATSKYQYVILALSSSMYLLVSKLYSSEVIVSALLEKMDILSKIYRNSELKREVGQSVIFLCEGLQEIIEASSDLSVGQNRFFCSNLSSLLTMVSTTEQKAILNLLNCALKKILNLYKEDNSAVAIDIFESIWNNFKSYLEVKMLVPDKCLSHVVSICSLIIQCVAKFSSVFPSNTTLQNAHSVLIQLIFNGEKLKSKTCLLFFVNLARSDEETLTYMSKLHPNFEAKVVRFLLENLVDFGSDEDVCTASEVIFTLPQVSSALLDKDSLPVCPFAAFEFLLQSLTEKFKTAETLYEKQNFRNQAQTYLSTLSKTYSNVLKQKPLPNHLPELSRMVASFIEKAASLLYIRSSSSSVVPGLISCTMFPKWVFELDKPFPPQFSRTMTVVIPKVIRGLLSLGFINDSFISRNLKDIFSNYIHRYSFACHPFMEIFADSSLPHADKLRSLFLSSFVPKFVSKNITNFNYLQSVISFLTECLINDSNSWSHPVAADFSLHFLELLLNLEESCTKQVAVELLKKILVLAKDDCVSKQYLLANIEKFVNCHLPLKSSKVFRLLEVITVLSPTIMEEALTFVERSIQSTELSRGSGVDQSLRRAYNSLLARLSNESRSDADVSSI